MATVDVNDPCAVLAVLRQTELDLLTGAKPITVEFLTGNGSGRRVTYDRVKLTDLRQAIARYESACAQAGGGAPKRQAIIGGFRS